MVRTGKLPLKVMPKLPNENRAQFGVGVNVGVEVAVSVEVGVNVLEAVLVLVGVFDGTVSVI